MEGQKKDPAPGHGEKPAPWDDGAQEKPAPVEKPGHGEKPAPWDDGAQKDETSAPGQGTPGHGEKPAPWDD